MSQPPLVLYSEAHRGFACLDQEDLSRSGRCKAELAEACAFDPQILPIQGLDKWL